LLIPLAEVKLSGRKQPLDDHVVPLDPVGDEVALPSGPISRTSGISPWSMPFALTSTLAVAGVADSDAVFGSRKAPR
jgi:hypothetical protein